MAQLTKQAGKRVRVSESMACPGCSGRTKITTELTQVYECASCGGIIGECYRGDAYKFVNIGTLVPQTEGMEVQYFDLVLLGSDGIKRVHGWFDRQTKNVVQYG